jgi:hypothetical protein
MHAGSLEALRVARPKAVDLERINQFVHNRYTAPTDRELGLMWAKLEPLLENLMEEPEPPSAS